MNWNNFFIYGGMILFIILVGVFVYNSLLNNSEAKDIQNATSSQVQIKTCVFKCIDAGYEGGYYTNWINKCVCRIKK